MRCANGRVGCNAKRCDSQRSKNSLNEVGVVEPAVYRRPAAHEYGICAIAAIGGGLAV